MKQAEPHHNIYVDHHEHGHAHNSEGIVSVNAAFIIGICLNTLYVVIEAVYGVLYNSMGLLSDAGHNLSDVASLLLALVAFRLMKRKPDSEHTYGYKKFSIQASLINALLLYIAIGAILVEAIKKLIHPTAVDGDVIAWVAAAGVIINGLTAWLLMKGQSHDMNVKAAFLHMTADTLVSVGVVVSGIIIHSTDFYVLDPIIGIVIALIIAWTSRGLLVESTRMSIDAVPRSIDMDALAKALESVEGVHHVHHLHVWALSTTENALTVHVVIDDVSKLNPTISAVRKTVAKFGITHPTVEVETHGLDPHENQMFDTN